MSRFFKHRPPKYTGIPKFIPNPKATGGNVNTIGPRSCYDEGKRCAETLFFDYYRQHELPVKVARIFNTYGPGMHLNDGRVVSSFIVSALNSEDIIVHGDGQQTRSFCYVADLIDGVVRLMNSPDEITGPMNLGNPHEITVLELAEKVIDLTGSRSRIKHLPALPDDPRRRCPDITIATTTLGWEPRIPLEAGLRETVSYFENVLRRA